MILVTQSKASTYPYAPTRQALSKKSKEKPRPDYFKMEKGHLKINTEHPEWIAMLKRREKENPQRIIKVPKKIRDIVDGGTSEKKKVQQKKEVARKEPEKKREGNKKGAGKTGVRKKNETMEKRHGGNGTKERDIEPKKTKAELKREQAFEEDSHELQVLARRSYRADLEAQILKNESQSYENELKKTKLQKENGNLIELSLAKYLFTGYMEKLNIELLGLSKKIFPMIDNMVKEKDSKGIVKRYDREFQNILVGIRKAQSDDLEEWTEEVEI